MTKTILITGATDGIGLETARMLATGGHKLLLHGRSEGKLAAAAEAVSSVPGAGSIKTHRADLSNLGEVEGLAQAVSADSSALDVLINNAGVFAVPNPVTPDGYDVRFIVNTVAPYDLTQRLLPLMGSDARVVNLSSAAQAPVNVKAFLAKRPMTDGEAYAQSKLALTMWSFDLAQRLGSSGPAIIAVNPASFLGSKMVKEAYGRAGHDLNIGADILVRAALSEEFENATGRYFDNDRRAFTDPHPDALDPTKNKQVVSAIEDLIAALRSM